MSMCPVMGCKKGLHQATTVRCPVSGCLREFHDVPELNGHMVLDHGLEPPGTEAYLVNPEDEQGSYQRRVRA